MSEVSPEATREQIESEMSQLFLPYRGFCARKGIQSKEVVLEETDVAKAIVEYINATNQQHRCRSFQQERHHQFRNPDVPTSLMKSAPDFCTVYVIAKGKTMTVRSAKTQAPSAVAPPRHAPIPPSPQHIPTVGLEHDDQVRPSRISNSRESLSEELDFQSTDSGADALEFSTPSSDHSPTNSSPRASVSIIKKMEPLIEEVEAEMKRLRLELKQTMDMYSTACKEAITAKQKAREFHQWKLEEARRIEEAKHAEEAALAVAEMEKAKCRAAIEAAQAAQRLAEIEAQKRHNAELNAKREAEEKKKALEALAHNDIRYRKYSIEEIEVATDFFADSLKIGEGGYGPVYKACLDHTPVAIKVLRPDAAQGRRQFQQEVEVLSCIRHPNMVLLLGACPEYGCLVYEYMDNGSLDDRLFRRGNTPPIPWNVRFKIAAEIATGLLFLHQTKPEPLVHRDLKPANILLDRNYVSKISDVGLARLVPPSVADSVTQYRMTSTAGTFCYIDPEYQQTGMLGIKSDIYSLGIMLLQIITAKPPMGLTHHMLDPAVPDWPMEEALGYAKLALKCAELRRKDRPDLGTVIFPELNRLRNLGHAWEATRGSGGGSSSSVSGSFGRVFHSYANLHPRTMSQAQQVSPLVPKMPTPRGAPSIGLILGPPIFSGTGDEQLPRWSSVEIDGGGRDPVKSSDFCSSFVYCCVDGGVSGLRVP
ncbi:unnamed protein product [Spirodela intermedia]|uniref:Protein kinase domain-containing protein n=1 Tax=Spirodela intermedia TaxID=51605 RepID=A0A7I8J9Q8_SPIIN|nr:unnamed protein product [Spirodela intermedia]CAA6666182.1 unnamed protein product [Spirodela intermedia]